MDTQDLVVAGRIGDVESNYHFLAELGMHALLSIYCAKGKDFDQVFFKKEMKYLGFHPINYLLNWKFGGMLSLMILEMTKLKGSGQYIEICLNQKISLRKVMLYCNEI